MTNKIPKEIILCDIDGTIANNNHRQHLLGEFKDWDKFFYEMSNDEPIDEVIRLVKEEKKCFNTICFLTGRPERYREATETWLKKYFDEGFNLLMREDGDLRNKIEIKRELFINNFNINQIVTCFENDLELIQLWQELGVRVVDVNRIIVSI